MAPSWRDLGDAAVIDQNPSLSLATTRACGVTEEELNEFCEWLGKNTTITELHLRSNLLGDTGLQSLLEVLKVNNTLEKLYLSGNALTDACAEPLAEVLKVNNTLQ